MNSQYFGARLIVVGEASLWEGQQLEGMQQFSYVRPKCSVSPAELFPEGFNKTVELPRTII